MDIEGNKQADRLAKEGVKRHGVRLIEENNSPGLQAHTRSGEEEEQVEVKERGDGNVQHRVRELYLQSCSDASARWRSKFTR